MRNALTQDKPTLFRSQHGLTLHASSLEEFKREARERHGLRGNVEKQYCDKRDGRTVWNGYIVGGEWFTAFHWAEVEQ